MYRKIGILCLVVFVVFSGCISGPDSQKGTISLTSSPSGSEVYLDNQYRGSTPVIIPDVETGTHTLEYRHTGYKSWSTSITVPAGPSGYYAALSTLAGGEISPGITQTVNPATTQAAVTIQVGKETMIIGESNVFSGRASGTDRVLLTLYGPGKYEDGVSLVQQNVDGLGRWSYTWNPGSAVQSGSYTMIVSDAWKTTSERIEFTVIGGGLVSISSSTASAGKGDAVTFSGQCTTGAKNVVLVLYGPGQFAVGKELGSTSVTAGKTWSFKYILDATMPTGEYTVSVRDMPNTASSTTRFSVGFAS